MAAATRRWATPETVREKVRRRWDDGTLLRTLALGEPMAPLEVSLSGPRASELGDRLGEVQDWAAALEDGSRGGERYELRFKEIGGRTFGRNQIPTHAVVYRFEQAWRLLGVRAQVSAFEQMVLSAPDQRVREWLLARPVPALGHHAEWSQLLTAYRWLDAARGSGKYLRQIDAPGVDTKFVEARRSVLADLLGVSRQAGPFLTDLGLRTKPEYVRIRLAASVAPVPVSELSVRVGELDDLDIRFSTAVVVENEITYLTLPVPADGVVIWGKGFDVARLGRWAALQDAQVHYWGDLDTHGFAILHRLRTHLPQTRSFLMDAETLHAHRDRWGRENSPTSAALDRLAADEAAVYDDLVSDRFGERVRLEQERINWAWTLDKLPYDRSLAQQRLEEFKQSDGSAIPLDQVDWS